MQAVWHRTSSHRNNLQLQGYFSQIADFTNIQGRVCLVLVVYSGYIQSDYVGENVIFGMERPLLRRLTFPRGRVLQEHDENTFGFGAQLVVFPCNIA